MHPFLLCHQHICVGLLHKSLLKHRFFFWLKQKVWILLEGIVNILMHLSFCTVKWDRYRAKVNDSHTVLSYSQIPKGRTIGHAGVISPPISPITKQRTLSSDNGNKECHAVKCNKLQRLFSMRLLQLWADNRRQARVYNGGKHRLWGNLVNLRGHCRYLTRTGLGAKQRAHSDTCSTMMGRREKAEQLQQIDVIGSEGNSSQRHSCAKVCGHSTSAKTLQGGNKSIKMNYCHCSGQLHSNMNYVSGIHQS